MNKTDPNLLINKRNKTKDKNLNNLFKNKIYKVSLKINQINKLKSKKHKKQKFNPWNL